MTFSVFGLPVSRGIAIGRAVLVASSRVDVAHYFIEPEHIVKEMARLHTAKLVVESELQALQNDLPKDAPPEISALLDVHLMLLHDVMLTDATNVWIAERCYNAEWALSAQLEVLARQFDEMDDPYISERKADLEQVVERLLLAMNSEAPKVITQRPGNDPLVMVAHDIAPADMLQFKRGLFVGFATDVGGRTSHTAIVARSLDIPAIVGARDASRLIRQDDWVIIDGDSGLAIVDPSPEILSEYRRRQQQELDARVVLSSLRDTPTVTKDNEFVELMANIESPDDTATALKEGAVGVGLFRSEFLFMNRDGHLPDEEEQFLAYKQVVENMQGLPVTIRTVDVGADKPLDKNAHRNDNTDGHLNPALGLRAIRWSLADPDMFVTQLRAIYRASVFGTVRLLIPMLAHAHEIRQTLALIEQAQKELLAKKQPFSHVPIGAMIEIPAAALTLPLFVKHFDFLSIGTNDLIQYTLAVDRADESVSHLYDPLHPAVLKLIADTIRVARVHHKGVSVCGEMAGDVSLTRLLLGLGLRSFSMHPAQLLSVKKEILTCHCHQLAPLAQLVLSSEDPTSVLPMLKDASGNA